MDAASAINYVLRKSNPGTLLPEDLDETNTRSRGWNRMDLGVLRDDSPCHLVHAYEGEGTNVPPS